jgi:hypothetical protein
MYGYGTIHPATGGGFDAVETGQVVDVASAEEIGYLVGGTFVGTIKIEVSFDGTTFVELASLTAPGVALITVPVKQVRARCSAYTSGLAVAYCSYRETNPH